MSLMYEQRRALWETRKLLVKLSRGEIDHIDAAKYATGCLRHYPYLDDTGKPMFSRDSFPCPNLEGGG